MPLGVIILYVTMSRALVSAQPSVFTDTADAGWNETFYSFYRIDQYSVRTRTNTGVTSSFATISHAAEGSLVHRSWVTRFKLLPSCHNRASASRRVPVAPQLDFSPVAVDSIFHSTALPHSLGALTDLKKSPTDLEPGYPASVNVLRAVALFSFFPRSGPREGGTTIILQGTGFRRSRQVVCSFNFITAHSLIVPATVLSTTKLMCTSPRCTSERAAVVAVSVDGNNFVRAKGLSTLADTFYFTSHVPTGKFTSENATGPFTGGTLITVSNPILTSSKENLPPPLGGFEPSVLSTCLFAHRQHPSPSNNTFKLSDHGLSYNVTTSVKWLGYNRVQCVSPPWPVSTSGSTVLVTVHISNNGQDYSQAGVNFTYYDVIPVVSHIYTKQNAGAFEARGPWTGNTKVFIVGRGFQPSEYLIARFVSYEQVNGDLKVNHEHREGKCTFHDSGTVYCITPAWYPNLSSTTGKLKPCFETSVDISNDNGTRWSLSTTAKFVYCPVYVSTYGSNTWGDGTPRMPYRDLSRAIQAALTEPMSITSTRSRTKEHHGFSFGSNSYNKYLNSDQIVLMEGIYNDDSGLLGCERNLNLAMHGRVLEVGYIVLLRLTADTHTPFLENNCINFCIQLAFVAIRKGHSSISRPDIHRLQQ
jgi:hypothetical protein